MKKNHFVFSHIKTLAVCINAILGWLNSAEQDAPFKIRVLQCAICCRSPLLRGKKINCPSALGSEIRCPSYTAIIVSNYTHLNGPNIKLRLLTSDL